jgi:AcrR family transcriptional regulator
VDNAIPYERQGRIAQKARTRAAIVDAAVDLIARGEAATLEAAAARAGVGRGTAYRYFPNQRALLAAAHPRATAESMLPSDAPSDPLERLRIVVGEIIRMTSTTEPALRAMLRLSLGDDLTSRGLPLRVGRRIVWVDEALAPLATEVAPGRLQTLTIAVAAVCGIEVYVWLKDIAGLSGADAAGLQRWMAEILLLGGLGDDAPPAPSTDANIPAIRSRVGGDHTT